VPDAHGRLGAGTGCVLVVLGCIPQLAFCARLGLLQFEENHHCAMALAVLRKRGANLAPALHGQVTPAGHQLQAWQQDAPCA